jgi:hypothetical protein
MKGRAPVVQLVLFDQVLYPSYKLPEIYWCCMAVVYILLSAVFSDGVHRSRDEYIVLAQRTEIKFWTLSH